MQESNNSWTKISLVLLVVIAIAFVAGFYAAKTSEVAGPSSALSNATSSEPDSVDFSPFWKAWNILNANYVDATTSASTTQNEVWGAIQGMTASLGDPYTVFFPPAQNQAFNDEISGSFGGVGMEMGIQNSQIVIIAPLKGTPADLAGVKSGDVLISVNGQDATTMTLDQVISIIRGNPGTTVTISVGRKGVSAPISFTLTRATINVPTIETSTTQSSISAISTTTLSALSSNHIYLITLYTFTADAADLFRGALKTFAASGDHKLIIDLRGNPGGYLDAAVDMASWFLPSSDTVVTEKYSNGQEDIYQSKGYDVFDNGAVDIVILVDGGSASASEIFSAALHDYGKATLVGVKTFGKGSVQELFNITPTTSLKVTIAKWLTPKGVSISEKGITPDYVVPVTIPGPATAGQDAQMQKAISLLASQN